LKHMVMRVSRNIASSLQQLPFYAAMVDITTDVSNREQKCLLLFSPHH